jgi:voltage-gated potassium channel
VKARRFARAGETCVEHGELGCSAVLLSIAMYYGRGAVNTVTRMQLSLGETFYFCAVTALTIGYGDVVPTTTLGRIIAVLLAFIGVLMTGVITGSTVYGIQVAAQRAGLRPG